MVDESVIFQNKRKNYEENKVGITATKIFK